MNPTTVASFDIPPRSLVFHDPAFTMEHKRILIVDDESHIRMTLKQMLEDAGYGVATAESGPVALDYLDNNDCDLVLLDVRMPGLDGFEVLNRLNEERPDLPVVIVTAHGTVDQAAEAIREGAESFVHKPFSPEQVRSVVAQALAEKPDAPDRTYDEHVQLAQVGIREEDFEKARRHIQEAFALDATRPEAFNLLGVLMQIQSKFQEAQRYYQSALSLHPGYEPAVYNRDNLARSPSVRDPSDYRLE